MDEVEKERKRVGGQVLVYRVLTNGSPTAVSRSWGDPLGPMTFRSLPIYDHHYTHDPGVEVQNPVIVFSGE